MQETKKMVCPVCGVVMNRHALKVEYHAAPDSNGAFDPELGGVLEEAHACPACGLTLTRPADAPDS
jgi:ribosomal protein S27AE